MRPMMVREWMSVHWRDDVLILSYLRFFKRKVFGPFNLETAVGREKDVYSAIVHRRI